MNEICICGDGNTAYMLAILLKQHKLYVSKIKTYQSIATNLSNVITMKLNVLTKDEYEFLESRIDFSDLIVHKKAGYKFNGKIYDEATSEMIHNYLAKQNRDIIHDFKFETEFDAIDLSRLFIRYASEIEFCNDKSLPDSNCVKIVTNSQFNRDADNCFEYVLNQQNEMYGYSYIYDCDLYSNVKRYSKDNIELINFVEDAIEVKNYYDAPKIFSEYNFKKNIETFWVGRYASKTRIEQIDVLRFCMKLIKEKNYEL